MEGGDFLFKLIKGLSVTEKSYFKKFAFKNSAKSEKILLQLFDAISKQKVLDELTLKKQFFKEDPGALRFVKHALYKRLIVSLVDYTKDESVESLVWKKLSASKVLIDKGIYSSAKKQAESALNEALLAERYDLAFTCIQEIKSSYTNLRIDEQTYKYFRILEKQQQQYIHKM